MLTEAAFLAIQRFKEQNLSQRAVARQTGISRMTVQKYWNQSPEEFASRSPSSRPNRVSRLEPYREFIEREFVTAGENCDVVRQRLMTEKNVSVPIRTLQDFLKPYRDRLVAERADLSKSGQIVESAPGLLMQIDFGEKDVRIGGQTVRVHFFVATLCYCRRVYVEAFLDEIQERWLDGVERAFRHFGGVPQAILCDNAKTLVNDAAKPGEKICTFNTHFRDFCRYWRVTPVASHPYYPQSKGKVERMVRYVKENCLMRGSFQTFDDLQDHLRWWMTEVSDVRVMRHLDKSEEPVPIRRYEVERKELLPADKPPFQYLKRYRRKVNAKGLLTVDNRHYQLSAEWINQEVQVESNGNELSVYYGAHMIRTFNSTLDAVKHITIPDLLSPEGLLNFGASEPEILHHYKESRSKALLENGELGPGLLPYEEAAGGKI